MTKEQDPALDAASRLFRRKGFAATTVREIAKEAGMLPGSLHYRYASKDELLIALMERGVAAAMDAVRAAVAPEPDPVERLRLGLRAHLSSLLAEDGAVFVLLYDWRALEDEAARARMERLRSMYEGFWDGLLAGALATGRGRPGLDSTLVRQFGFGAVNWVATWYRPEDGRTPEEIADAFFSMLALGLLADEGGPHGRIAAPNARKPPPARTAAQGRKRVR